MARIIAFVFLSQIASNGYWLWFTIPLSFDNPLIIIPILATLVCICSLIVWIFQSWDEET